MRLLDAVLWAMAVGAAVTYLFGAYHLAQLFGVVGIVAGVLVLLLPDDDDAHRDARERNGGY